VYLPYFDFSYIYFIMPAIIFAVWAQARVKNTYEKYSRVINGRGITGAQAAESILRSSGIYDVGIEHIEGNLTDHYDPRSKVIRLSDGVYHSRSVAAVGIAAHEAGHAVQHNIGYTPLKIRNAIIPVTQLGSNAAVPLIILGLILSFPTLIYFGILLFIAVVVFQVITLPVEFNASSRALTSLAEGLGLTPDEKKEAKRVLSAAAMTYVAALAVSLAQLLRLLAIAGRRR
jgi:Zn-dependent membrane protease YugP